MKTSLARDLKSDGEWAYFECSILTARAPNGRKPTLHRVVRDGVFCVARTGSLARSAGRVRQVVKRPASSGVGRWGALGADQGTPRQGFGRWRGGFTIKNHLLVNAAGLPMRTEVTAGQTSDYSGFNLVMADNLPTPSVLLVDEDYDAESIRETMDKWNVLPVIPMRRSRKKRIGVDRSLYRLRNLVEWCFNKLKNARCVATRYDKTAKSVLSHLKNDPPLGLATRTVRCRQARRTVGVTFGTGTHSCPGHILAKVETEAVIERLVTMKNCELELVQPDADECPVNFRHSNVHILCTDKGTASA